LFLLFFLACNQANATWSPPTKEIRATYALEQPEPYFKNWDRPTRGKYTKLRAEQIKLVDVEEELYNTALSPSYFNSASFSGDLKAIEQAGPPKFIKNECETADQKLNEAFQKALKSFGTSRGPCKACEELLRKVERQWLKYREAWVTFGMTRFPKSSRESWLCWQTKKRQEHISEYDIDGP
jgi:uncharacterized protein YecT (DUF1311 family)